MRNTEMSAGGKSVGGKSAGGRSINDSNMDMSGG